VSHEQTKRSVLDSVFNSRLVLRAKFLEFGVAQIPDPGRFAGRPVHKHYAAGFSQLGIHENEGSTRMAGDD